VFAGEVGDRLLLEPEEADHVDDAGHAGEGGGADPTPTWASRSAIDYSTSDA
jgi:hypothetical protein